MFMAALMSIIYIAITVLCIAGIGYGVYLVYKRMQLKFATKHVADPWSKEAIEVMKEKERTAYEINRIAQSETDKLRIKYFIDYLNKKALLNWYNGKNW